MRKIVTPSNQEWITIKNDIHRGRYQKLLLISLSSKYVTKLLTLNFIVIVMMVMALCMHSKWAPYLGLLIIFGNKLSKMSMSYQTDVSVSAVEEVGLKVKWYLYTYMLSFILIVAHIGRIFMRLV
jgi:hypothetical protein